MVFVFAWIVIHDDRSFDEPNETAGTSASVVHRFLVELRERARLRPWAPGFELTDEGRRAADVVRAAPTQEEPPDT